LLEYCWRSGRCDRNVLDGFSLQHTIVRAEPKSLNLDEARQLIETCASTNSAERRERLMILLLYGCGLRTGEVCNLDVGDVNRERQEILIRKAKHDRPRVVPIPDGVYMELLSYLLDLGNAVHSFAPPITHGESRNRMFVMSFEEQFSEPGFAME